MLDKNNMDNGRGNTGAKTSDILGYWGGGWKMSYF